MPLESGHYQIHCVDKNGNSVPAGCLPVTEADDHPRPVVVDNSSQSNFNIKADELGETYTITYYYDDRDYDLVFDGDQDPVASPAALFASPPAQHISAEKWRIVQDSSEYTSGTVQYT